MGMGLQIFNSAGQLTFATGDRLPRFLGVFNTGTSDGSYSDANIVNDATSGDQAFSIVIPLGIGGTQFQSLSFTNYTFSWSFDPNETYRNDSMVLYGLW